MKSRKSWQLTSHERRRLLNVNYWQFVNNKPERIMMRLVRGAHWQRRRRLVCHHLRYLLEGKVCPEVVYVWEAGGAGGVRHWGRVVAKLPLPDVYLVDGDPDGDVGVHHLQPGDLTPQPADLFLLVLSFLESRCLPIVCTWCELTLICSWDFNLISANLFFRKWIS